MPQTQRAIDVTKSLVIHSEAAKRYKLQGVPFFWEQRCITCIAAVTELCVMFGWKWR